MKKTKTSTGFVPHKYIFIFFLVMYGKFLECLMLFTLSLFLVQKPYCNGPDVIFVRIIDICGASKLVSQYLLDFHNTFTQESFIRYTVFQLL